MPMRDFIGPHPAARLLPTLVFERRIQVALLWTENDRREDSLRDEMRLSQRRCHPQLLIRFGYGPEGRPTPRASTHHTTDAGPGSATPGTSTDSAD
ncbi:hypothetical protein [Streptomyces sp. RG80]|uniref:hypothetical protein n=1 Tax=Streptomyces sp. RG80 TaxID=3157340 RepID=UPI0033901EA4